MTREARNTEILRKAYALWDETKGGSVDHWLSVIADELNFASLAQGRPDAVAFTKARHTREGVADYLSDLTAGWEMIDYAIDHFVAQGDRVVAIGRTAWRNKATTKVVDTPKVDVWRFNDDGMAIEFFEYYDTAAIIAAASSLA